MNESYIHNLIVQLNTMDILSADSEFYNFMGERLYFTFEKFIYKNDLQLFQYKLEHMDSSYFIIKMYSQSGNLLDFIMRISPGPNQNQFAVRCVELHKLIDEHLQLIKHQSIDYNVLNLYNDRILVYYPDKMDVVIYEPSFDGREFKVISLNELDMYIPGDTSALQSSLKNGDSTFEFIFRDNNNNAEITQVRGMSIYNNGEFLKATGFIHKDSKELSTATKQPQIDSLTGTLTKNEITNFAVKKIDVDKCEGTSIAIIDIDYFKNINDIHGHLKGDEILRSISDIIKQQVGNAGLVGRFGGDEFFVVFYNGYNQEKTREILRSLKNIVNATYSPNDDGNLLFPCQLDALVILKMLIIIRIYLLLRIIVYMLLKTLDVIVILSILLNVLNLLMRFFTNLIIQQTTLLVLMVETTLFLVRLFVGLFQNIATKRIYQFRKYLIILVMCKISSVLCFMMKMPYLLEFQVATITITMLLEKMPIM